MLKKFIIVSVLVSSALVIFIAKQPEDFNVSKTISINAAAPDIFFQINDFHKWEAWSPWAKLDDKMEATFEGSEFGIGAVYEWSGNKEVGAGSMVISESVPGQSIKITLEMTEPVTSSNITEFIFKEEKGQTTVTWNMSGKKSFVAKAMGLVFNCEEEVSKEFEKGLSNLKKFLEENPAKQADESATVESEVAIGNAELAKE